MLHFEPEYFKEEERGGFTIPAFMKNAWAAQLEMLAKVDLICKENDIPYFADWGTLLGAIRHKGYIPWDDDIDLCMMREDLYRFVEAVDNYDEIEIDTVFNTPDHGMHAARVMNSTVFTTERSKCKEYHGFPFPAGLDIFTIDYVPRDKALEEEQIGVLRMISTVVHTKEWLEENNPSKKGYSQMKKEYRKCLKLLQEQCGMEFSVDDPTEQEILILGEEVSGLYGDEDSDFLSELPCLGNNMDYYIPKDVYADFIRMPFENTTIPVPVGYDFLLRKKYGDDYMTPKNTAPGHEYPFYNAFIRAIFDERKHGDFDGAVRYVEKMSSEYYRNFLAQKPEPVLSYRDDELNDSLTRARAAECEVLEEIKRLCSISNTSIFTVGETLEGAIKCKDFLPERDGIHLAIKREDVNDFILTLQQELDSWFNYSTLYSTDNHEDMRMVIYTDGYMCEDDDYKKRFHGCDEVVGIDISIIDKISNDEEKENLRKSLIEGLLNTANIVSSNPPYSKEILEIVDEWKEKVAIDVDINKNLRREFVKAADNIAGSVRDEDVVKVRISADLQEGIDSVYDRDDFATAVEMKFGKTTVSVPVGYEHILDR